MTEYNILNKPGRKKMMLFFGLVFLTAIAFFYINSARMDDFTSLITDTTVQYQNNGVMKDYTADVHLEDNTPLSFLIKATVPQGTLASIENVESEEETTQETVVKNQTLTYNLPEQLKVEDTQTNKLYLENDLVHSIGTYEIRNNLLTMYFDEDHVNTNAESELKLALVLETDSSHVIYDVNGSSLVSFNTKNIELNKYIEQPTETTVTNQVDEQVVEEVVTASNYTNNAVAADAQDSEEEQTGNIETTDKSVDFGKYLTGATVMKNVNGHWQKVENNTFTDGDQVQVSLSYQLPPNTVDENNKVIYYQLPDGVRPIEEQSGEVKQHGKVVGHYVINKEGKILIEFNDEFADGEAFTGDIQFEGTISKTGDGDQDEINFGNDTEKIIVTKKKDNYDLDLKKKATLSEDKSKINYQIVASTTNGTGESLKITDSFVSNTNATGTYDKSSMKLYKVSADGTKTEVTDKTPTINTTNGQQTFTYDNLDKLEKGEQYIVEYSANVEESNTKTDGSSKVQNNAYASNKYVNRWAGTTTEISKTMISKEGWYDQSTGLIKWQIKVNAGKQDISGYNLKDALPEGIEFSGNIEMTDSSGTTTTIIPNGTNIDYTFPNNSKDSYTVTYYTTAPNENGNVSNTSTIGKDGKEYTSTGVVGVTHRTWAVNKSWKNETVSTDGQRKYNWYASVVIPEGNLTEFTYVDTIKDAVDEKGSTHQDTHYAIASELDAELKKNVHLNSNNGYIDASVDFEFIYKDADGNVIEATDTTTHVKSFEIKVKPKEGQTITNAQRLSIDSYSTILDTSNQTAGESWKFSNTGKKDDLENNSTHSYSKPKPVVKQGGVKSEYGVMTYKSGTVSADLEETNGILYYRVLINTDLTDNEAINLTDIMPEGAEYVEGSLQAAFYVNDSYSYPMIDSYNQSLKDEDPSGWDAVNNKYVYDLTAKKKPTIAVDDGQIHITIPKGYNCNLNSDSSAGHTIQLTYQMKVSDDSSWNDPTQTQKTYENKVTWGNNSDSQKMEMTRELSEVQKNGAQIYNDDGQPTGKVKYNVIINPAGRDLDNRSDTLTLKDKLTLPSGASATLSLDETKLYYLDLSKKDNNYHGEVVDSSLYRIAYDDINNEISVIVPDEFACVLEYTYVVDEGNIAGDYQISNSATLNGQFSDSVETNIENLSSSATVEKGKMKIYKVDDKDYTKRLTGAEFKLWKFNTTDNQWEDITSTVAYDKISIKTNKNGEIIFQGDANNQLLEMATIYKLTEIKAPKGYDLSKDPYYFVLVQKDQNTTIEETKRNMASTFQNANVDINKTHFFNNNEEVYMYITNHTSNVNVHKVWVDSNNKPITNGSNDIKVQLYKTTKKKETCTVNLHLTGLNGVTEKTITVSKNKPFTLKFVHYGSKLNLTSDEITVTKDGQNYGMANIAYDNNDTYITVTTQNVTNDCDICITDTTHKFWFSDKFELTCDEPDVSITRTKVGDAVTLSGANSWSYKWSGDALKENVTDGEDYYYTVEEVGVPSGYQVSYTNNDGIQEGDITVTNKKLDNYDLPDTGGFGTFGYYAIGALFITATLFAYIANIKKKGAYNK
ncbi:SpaA isopeptide-forming pilin-related protein [uncultured Catenibacterium sp.]|uniref:SpaA isopeptide-forming pilin-related protein n=1 Tax=uncultured Catenibacterium sp. TaxID=286142 RepID=UPI00260130F9|nr:SpaA isopeptide-forming pilin-related protein [uncultured Catenibacterium sp.]